MRSLSLLPALTCLLITVTATGQVRPGDLRIEVDQDGLYEVRWNDLAPFVAAGSVDSERMRLMQGNIEVPLAFRSLNDGRFGRSSSFFFYGERDRAHHSDLGVYRLQFREARQRIGRHRPRRTAETMEEGTLLQHFEEDLIYDPMKTVDGETLDLPRADRAHWFWARIPPADHRPGEVPRNHHSFLLRPSPRPRPVDKTPATLTISLRAPIRSTSQEIVCELGGQVLGRKSWTGTNKLTVDFEVPTRLIKAATVLTIRNISEQLAWEEPENQMDPRRRNDILVDAVTLKYKTLLTGPTTKQPQIVYDVQVPRASGPISLKFVNTGGLRGRFYDVTRQAWLDGTVVDCPPARNRRIVAVNDEGFFQPTRIGKWSTRDLKQITDGADWVCITLERFAGLVSALEDLRSRQGLKTLVVTDREIYDSYNGGRFSPGAIQTFLSSAHATWKKKPRFVLLVGDADHDVNWKSKRPVLPTRQTTTYFNGETASDRALLPPGCEDIAVGRLPARRDDEVLKMVRRIVEYETETQAGSWNRRLNFIASEGRFGPMVDTLLENYARKMLTEIIPASYDVTMTYASQQSSYLYPPEEFNDKVIDRFNEGSLVYTYMGHGYRLGFDRLRSGKKRFPIFGVEDIARIDSGMAPPLMAIIACSTAHFDSPDEDCVGERLMRSANGPIALIGSTRVSHPFSNALLSKELLRGLFGAEDQTIGEILVAAQHRLVNDWKKDPISKLAVSLVGKMDVDRLMKDHRHMYVLFGDPASRLLRPAQKLKVSAPDSAVPGGTISVSAQLADGEDAAISLTLESRRDRIIFPVTKVTPQTEDRNALIKANYRAANQKKVAEVNGRMNEGRFATTMTIPATIPPGPYLVKAYSRNGRLAWAGSTPVTITAAEEKKD